MNIENLKQAAYDLDDNCTQRSMVSSALNLVVEALQNDIGEENRVYGIDMYVNVLNWIIISLNSLNREQDALVSKIVDMTREKK